MEYSFYLEKHGLTQEYVEKTWGWIFRDGGIIMPAYDEDGKVHHTNTRLLNDDPSSAKFITETGTHPSLYGIHKVTSRKVVVYCEGQPDCVKLWQEGIPAVTATGGVKKFDDDLAIKLQNKVVYLCIDNDEAGKKEIEKYLKILGKYAQEIKFIELPVGVKDVCEFFTTMPDAKPHFQFLMESAPTTTLDSWLLANQPPEHKIESIDELFKAELPKENWIVDKVIPSVGISVFAGAAGTGKSFMSLDMARAIVSEDSWLDTFKITKKVNVLFLDKENERVNFRNRCRGLKMQGVSGIYRMVYPEIFQLGSSERNEKFSTFALEMSAFVRANDIGLIIFDSFVDFMAGDENSAGDTQGFFDAVRELLPGRSVLLLAHYTKTKEGDTRLPLERISGSRNIGAQITSGLAIESSKEADNELLISMIKARNTAKNTTKYKILMHSRQDPESPGDTLVVGFENTGEVLETVEKMTGAISLITDLVDNTGEYGVRIKVAMDSCKEAGIAERTAKMALSQMKNTGMFETRAVEGSREKTINRVVKVAKNDDFGKNYEK